MVPVEVDSIHITMHPEDSIEVRTLALGFTGPQILIGLTMGDDEALKFTVETGGIPIEDDEFDSYEQIALILSMLADQIKGEVDEHRGV